MARYGAIGAGVKRKGAAALAARSGRRGSLAAIAAPIRAISARSETASTGRPLAGRLARRLLFLALGEQTERELLAAVRADPDQAVGADGLELERPLAIVVPRVGERDGDRSSPVLGLHRGRGHRDLDTRDRRRAGAQQQDLSGTTGTGSGQHRNRAGGNRNVAAALGTRDRHG